jgi:N-succinyldiaminopimelate aminotransferase
MRGLAAARLEPHRASIFEEMSALALEHGAVDLGSGTPVMDLPEAAAAAAADAIAAGRNQYSPVAGEVALRRAVAAHTARFYGEHVDPLTEVTITCGVTEGILAAMTAFIEPGDEVVVLEPCYESYAPSILFAGGVPVPVTLHFPDFRLDPAELAAAFTAKTKALILNNPHNPTGKVFSRSELEEIAALCHRFDVLAIADEVYEHIVFDRRQHIPVATLPGMRDRTLTLSGASKTFSCSGWRIGWAIGPAVMQEALNKARQFSVFCAPTPLQLAISQCLELEDGYFTDLAAEYELRRDLLLDALAKSPFRASQPAGSFFILASFDPSKYVNARECCYELARGLGVVPVPLDTFYFDSRHAEPLIRFTFCHPREILLEASKRLSSTKSDHGPRVAVS